LKGVLKLTEENLKALEVEVKQFIEDRKINDTISNAIKEVLQIMKRPFYETPCENCWDCRDMVNNEPNWKMFYCRYNN
jgi:hypothetical protein